MLLTHHSFLPYAYAIPTGILYHRMSDTADDLQEKVKGKRRASKEKFMDEFDSEAEKGREMHDTHSAIQAYHQQMMKNYYCSTRCKAWPKNFS